MSFMIDMQNGLRTYRPTLENYIYYSSNLKTQVDAWIKGVKDGNVSRALLIVGPPGTGKTTLGIAACQNIGADPNDIQEVNCANTRTLDDARTLLETLSYAPGRGDFRVLVLDEVHQMVENAQQAFLTPLEKLPGTTIVVACTTHPEKLMPAFRRRFYELKIGEYGDDEILEILDGLPKDPAKPLMAASIATIVKLAQGNPGRAIALAESNSNAGDNQEKLALELLVVDKFFEALLSQDTRRVFLMAQQVSEMNRKYFFDTLLKYLEVSWQYVHGLTPSISSKEGNFIQPLVTQLKFQNLSEDQNKLEKLKLFAKLHQDVLLLSEKPLPHIKSWSMRAH
jgi:DNA polymerase III gamma/tau subunit